MSHTSLAECFKFIKAFLIRPHRQILRSGLWYAPGFEDHVLGRRNEQGIRPIGGSSALVAQLRAQCGDAIDFKKTS